MIKSKKIFFTTVSRIRYGLLLFNSLIIKLKGLKEVSEETVNHRVGQADFMGESYLLEKKGSHPFNKQS